MPKVAVIHSCREIIILGPFQQGTQPNKQEKRRRPTHNSFLYPPLKPGDEDERVWLLKGKGAGVDCQAGSMRALRSL